MTSAQLRRDLPRAGGLCALMDLGEALGASPVSVPARCR
jgi:hypothetical protein